LNAYRLVKGTTQQLAVLEPHLIGSKTHAFGFSGLIKTTDLTSADHLEIEAPTLEDIMVYHARKEGSND
jgi:ABC-2 type transport system ATP-binding protein